MEHMQCDSDFTVSPFSPKKHWPPVRHSGEKCISWSTPFCYESTERWFHAASHIYS